MKIVRYGSYEWTHVGPTSPLPHQFDERDIKVVVSRSTDANLIALHSFNDHSFHETGWSRYPTCASFFHPK